jgi:hypothetical protein
MKPIPLLLGVALAISGWLHAGAQTSDQPFARITDIHIEKENVVVEVEASAALAKVTLESSTRVGRKAWEPRAVEVLKPGGVGTVDFTFDVPLSPAIEILRVRGDFADGILPATFYEGTNKFVAATGSGGGGAGAGGPVAAAPGVADKNAVGGGESRSVVESDIWKLDGDTLYFFNQNRGLQVIDVSNPDNPVLTGTYDLPASGEDLYLLEHGKIALLAQDNCSWYGNSPGSRVVLLDVKNGVPVLVNELPVSGYIAESRLVGTALYVVANSYEQREVLSKDGTTTTIEWEWGSRVVSFDLSDFATAQSKSKDWVSGYGNVIYATDQYLFVAQMLWDNRTSTQSSAVNSYDIASPDGTFTKLATFNVGGVVQDKFKMQMSGEVFSVVVQINTRQPRATYLETYSMVDPKNPQRLAEVKIVENEQLYATRFDDNRLYAVTFFRIDPLWIFDLSNPADPKRLGELQIPGWSTYLQPLGDNLLAIGLDTNGTTRVSVQLFDVADAAKPSLLSKVLIGDQWSYSEANWDEKAFGVLPDEHLVLVPFFSSGNEGYTQGVQLVDLDAKSLTKRGVITQNMAARRATVHGGRILSLSSQELLTVDATDRDHPSVVKSTELAWEADRVHLAGNYVIEVDANGSGTAPALRVVKADDSSVLVKRIELKGLPYMGSTTIDGKLFVLQGRPIQVIYPEVYNPTNYFPIATNPASFLLSEFDLSALPELPLLKSTTKDGGTNNFYGQYEAIKVKPNVLVWRSKNSGFYPWFFGGPVRALGVADSKIGIGGGFMPIWWGGAAGHFIAVDPTTLTFTSELVLSKTNGWWNFGGAFTVDGKIYTSHQASEFDETIDPPPYQSSCWDEKTQTWHDCTIDPPPGYWVQRYYLDVIDYSDPTDPLVRKPANLPGTVIGVARNGELLYTRGYNIKPFDTNGADETLAASSYDGVQAHLITSMGFGQNWPRPAVGNGPYIYLGVAPVKPEDPANLEVWTLNDAGKFELVNSQTLSSPAQQFSLLGDILAVQTNDILLMDARTPAAPKVIGSGRANTCYGVLLDSSDGDVNRGLWVPVGWYGVLKVPVKGAQ